MSMRRAISVAAALVLAATGTMAACAEQAKPDHVKVGVFPVAAALPYFVALKRGYFTEAGIDAETVALGSPVLIVQAMVAGAIDATSNLVTIEGANINVRRPGTLKYIFLIGQNADHIFEQFVARADSKIHSLADLKGANLFTSPGPANVNLSKAILAKAGLKEGLDYRMSELPMNLQLGALKAGNFDGGYTLEPVASMMTKSGVVRRIEAGVISTYLIGDKTADAYAAGAALSDAFIAQRPDVAARFARAMFKGMTDVARDPSVRDYLVTDMTVAPEVVADVPMPYFIGTRDLDSKQIADFQKFIDFGVDIKVVAGPINVKTMIAPF
ncbi:ABC transporter substrate-binding protein [Bradyrhizobium prioriisuperbiae]|uniref:ABC transporter substrate-binding protein n=1 Tax=Bradyrhizobium prioriisuperbiae TaxID=2854389 RepID=UPI0028EAD880|nr:ABC transporter substrate-binding protein [Bradyrhizobium prioritasuperba]